ncbi:S-adenosyl-L-methionine-dependent methyltransferase [Aspergillus karnatakaensis]|uniref:tRNA(Phe) (4-demethylwyosine(37)-C(7)) aminocarboxypropyltransferase n=1 Tax=Aspergillus karnatakaensis TaxID=1810916 RepID=UPI003CCD83DF
MADNATSALQEQAVLQLHQKLFYQQSSRETPKRAQKQPTNPLQRGISEFIRTNIPPFHLHQHAPSIEDLSSSLPKRYTIYEPMLLLPLNVFSHPAPWASLYESLEYEQRKTLYASIATSFSRFGVTHVAMNAPIVLTDSTGQENRMRSPTGLVPLHGDFGPTTAASGDSGASEPSQSDYEGAFWVRTVQNQGIEQIWAPLYTMFSRGNITEKARILGADGTFEGLDERSLAGGSVDDVAVVDMYAGIGYFVFSYLRRGVKRVWGWEINGWSVEGLRRGCVENGWGCRVVKVDGEGLLSVSVAELVETLRNTDRVVIFQGDNGFAARVMEEVRAEMEGRRAWTPIRHVNLGLLPSSGASWDNACRIVDRARGGWVHVHENVDIREIEEMKGKITADMERFWGESADCHHVEQVKTYAPAVMHCVFDLKLSPHQVASSNITS